MSEWRAEPGGGVPCPGPVRRRAVRCWPTVPGARVGVALGVVLGRLRPVDHTGWTQVDEFIAQRLVPGDPVLDAAQADAAAAGLPPIAVSPLQGKLLHLLARSIGARQVVEVGTLAGYSAIWLGRALPPGGRMVTLEIDERHAEVARANLARAGLTEVVEVRVGRALDLLPGVADALPGGRADLVFIDADKASNVAYFAWAVDHTRPGGLIVVDNVVRGGAIVDPSADDRDTTGTKRLYDAVAAEPRVTATALQTVGSKGHDGLLVALVEPTG